MDIHQLKSKLVWQMTGEELIVLFRSENMHISPKGLLEENRKDKISHRYVYGLKGIAKLLGCSVSSAMRLKKSGKINEAIIQEGRKIIVDVDKMLLVLNNFQQR